MSKPIACPHCGKKYAIDERYQGKVVRCHGCRKRFEIDIAASVGLVVFDQDSTDSAVSIDSSGERSANSIGDSVTIAGGDDGPNGHDLSIGDYATVGPTVAVDTKDEIQDTLPFSPVAAKYDVLKELGRGGMSVVYLAEDKALGRQVVIKRMLELAFSSENTRTRFIREAKIMAKLQHQRIVRIYDIASDRQGIYLVMEYIAGQSLEDELTFHPEWQLLDALILIDRVAEGIAHAHALGVIHRDLKPGNIILRDRTDPVLIDFGLAKDRQGDDLTGSGVTLGTVGYMAPEQCGHGGTIDFRADVFALGQILAVLCRSAQPDSEPDDDAVLLPAAIIAKATATLPDQRYRTIGEMRTAIATAFRRIDAEQSFIAGEQARARSDFTAAIDCYRQTLLKDKNNHRALLHLGNVLIETGRYEEAVEPLQRAIAQKPEDDLAYRSLAHCSWHSGRTDQAVEMLAMAAANGPKRWDNFFNLGSVLVKLSRIEAAHACLLKAIALASDDDPQSAQRLKLDLAEFDAKHHPSTRPSGDPDAMLRSALHGIVAGHILERISPRR